MPKLDYWREERARAARTIREVFAKEQVREKIEQLTTETDPKLVMLGIIRLADSFKFEMFRHELIDALLGELKVVALPPEEREAYIKQREQWDAEQTELMAIFEATERRGKRQAFIESLESLELGEEERKLSKLAEELRSSVGACHNEEEKERLAEIEEDLELCERQHRRLRRRRNKER